MFVFLLVCLLASSSVTLGNSVDDGVDRWLKAFFANSSKVELYNFVVILSGESSSASVLTCQGGVLDFPQAGVFRNGNIAVEQSGNGTIITTTLGLNETNLKFDNCTFTDHIMPMSASVSLNGPIADLKLASYLDSKETCVTSLLSLEVRLNANLITVLDPESKKALAKQSSIEDVQNSFNDDIKMSLEDNWKKSFTIEVSQTMCNST